MTQYNNILDQITTTAQDSSFNGINLLNGDQLKLAFNETGKSTLTIQGVTFNAAGLGLVVADRGHRLPGQHLGQHGDRHDQRRSGTLRTEASALGSNLSIVQIRQDFYKNLINVLQTGSSNLTLADTNEEAANSQALSTRQSIAVSALALANQSPAERAPAAALSRSKLNEQGGGGNPAAFSFGRDCGSLAGIPTQFVTVANHI